MATKETEIHLLQHQPSRLVVLYQPLLQKLIEHYWKRLDYSYSSPSELLQYTQKKLPPLLQKTFKKQGEKTHIKTLIVEAARLLFNDFEDTYFLKNNSTQLVVKYSSMIVARVRSYVNTQNLKESDAEDVIQSVQEKLILKIQSGQLASFQGGALVRTFLFRVIENLIKDVLKSLRTKKSKIGSDGTELQEYHAVENSAFQSLMGKIDLEQQTKALSYLLQLYKNIDRQKFELSAKVNYQMILGNKDLKPLLLSDDYKVELLVVFGKNYTHFSTEELWKNLIVFTNHLEGKNNTFDALWKWFTRHRNWMTVKILFIQRYDGELSKKMTNEEKTLLSKISIRSLSKFVDDYFGEVIHAYYSH